MYCPRCGNQQSSPETKFCSKCGFALGGVSALLETGGTLPPAALQAPTRTPRQRGVRQGVVILLGAAGIFTLVALFSVFFQKNILLAPLTATAVLIWGILRIVYAFVVEEGGRRAAAQEDARLATSNISAKALPANPINTSEIIDAPSVTEHTTNILERD